MSRNRIDVHAHYLGGVVRDILGSATRLANYRPPVEWTADGAIAFMDRLEIERQILSVPIVTDLPEPGAQAWVARTVNEELAAVVESYPGRFGAFAFLPFGTADDAVAEIGFALDQLGLDGVLLPTNAAGHYLGDPFFEPILAELGGRGVPVFVHPENCPHADVLGFGRPSSVVEFPFDTARTVNNAIYRGVFQRNPGLQLILAHAGGVLPTLAWRIAAHSPVGRGPGDAEITPDHIAEVLRGLYYDTALAGSRASLLPTLEVTDPEHLLFGSDWPAAPEQVVLQNTGNLISFDGLTASQLAGVERHNARRLFPRFA